MKVLTVGGGGREHAIVEAFHRAGSEIFAVRLKKYSIQVMNFQLKD